MTTATSQPHTVRPLLEDGRVHIIGEYVESELLDRFTRLFVATWRHLPSDVRASIFEHWLPAIERLSQAALAAGAPPSRFAPVRLIGCDWPRSRRCSGFVTNAGFEMAFDGQHFAGEHPPFAAETIAHELAHVYQHAIGSRVEFADAEADAARLQREWGFWFGPRGRPTPEHAANARAAAVEAIHPTEIT